MTPMKPCTRCKEVKPRSEFGPNGEYPPGVRRWSSACKACMAAKSKARWHARQEKRAAEGWINPLRDWGDRFLEKVDDSGECWIWTGRLTKKGYGALGAGATYWLAHRLSYLLHNGDLPDGAFICHTCDNPPCCNPAHLYAGDAQTNATDASVRGRIVAHRGEEAGSARLTEAQVSEIRSDYAAGRLNQYELARKYGTCQSQVSNIVRRLHWTHVA